MDQQSLEHVIPDAIGGSLIINDVCKTCNSLLGSNIDVHLVSNFLIEMKRFDKNLLGRRKNLKFPLSKGELKPGSGKFVLWNPIAATEKRLKLERYIRFIKVKDGTARLLVSLDIPEVESLPVIIKKMTEKYRKKGYEINSTDINFEEKTVKNPSLYYEHDFDFIGYQLALLKIVYEVAYINLGSDFMEYEIAKSTRELLIKSNVDFEEILNHRIRGKIGFYKIEDDPFGFLQGPDHVIVTMGNPVNAIYVRIFDVFTCHILLKEDSQPILESMEKASIREFDTAKRTNTVLTMFEAISKYAHE